MALTFMQTVKGDQSFNYYQMIHTHPTKNYQIVLKNSIIDGADKGEYLWNTDEVCKNVLTFLKKALDY